MRVEKSKNISFTVLGLLLVILNLLFLINLKSQVTFADAISPNFLQVDYPDNYGIRVYSEPNDKTPTDQVLKGSTMWKVVGSKKNENGELFYCVGNHQWVKAQYAIYPIEKFSNVGYVDYNKFGSISVYGRPIVNDTVIKSLPSFSSWKINFKMNNGGKTFYQVGKGQWVLADYISLTPIHFYEAFLQVSPKTNANIPLYQDSGCTTPTGRLLKSKSIWKVFAASAKGYKLGNKQWVRNSGVKVYPITEVNQKLFIKYVPFYSVNVYEAPTIGGIHANKTGMPLPNGSTVRAVKKANIDGTIWYSLLTAGNGHDFWLESKYLSAKAIMMDFDRNVKILSPQGARVYTYADDAYPTNRVLKPGTRWHISGEIGGFYKVGKNQWIKAITTDYQHN